MESRAVDFSYSGFGTIGAAISDNSTHYQRYIDDNGTFLRDSLFGLRFDVTFNEQWSATSQVILAADDDEDDALEPQLKWTMLSYRPSNNWLIRAGRLSLGGLLNQQNLDVGVTYDMARLPSEVYLLSSAYDFNGVSITRTWEASDYEISLDGSLGKQKRYYRSYHNRSDSPAYYSACITSGGFILTARNYNTTLYKIGWHYSEVDPDPDFGILNEYTFIPLGYGVYTLGAPKFTSTFTVNTFFLGAQIPVGSFLVSGEGTALVTNDVDSAPSTVSAYISLSRKFGQWTPYITYAQTWTDGIDTWKKVKNATPAPQLGVTTTVIEDAASAMAVYEQNSWMVGAVYAITPKQKIKAELMLTHVGDRSAMFDGNIEHENVTVASLSYNFAF